MEQPTTITGQLMALHHAGYSTEQIWRELKSRPGNSNLRFQRVAEMLAYHVGQSGDSRRLFEIHEMLVELLAIGRELVAYRRQHIPQRMRGIEKRDLSAKKG
jgi:hypothetical protein